MKTDMNVIVDNLLVEWGVGRRTNREFWTEFAIGAARRAVAARHGEYTKVADYRSPTTGSANRLD